MKQRNPKLTPLIIFTVIFCITFFIYSLYLKSNLSPKTSATSELPVSSVSNSNLLVNPETSEDEDETIDLNQVIESESESSSVIEPTEQPTTKPDNTDDNQSNIPGAIEFLTPTANQKLDVDKEVKFTWKTPEGVEYYRISLKDKTNNKWLFRETRLDATSTSFTYEAGKLSEGCDYKAYLDACNSSGMSKATVTCYTEKKQAATDGKYSVKQKYLVLNTKKANYINDDDDLSSAIAKVQANAKTIQDYYDFTPQQKACLNSLGESLSGKECYSDYKFKLKDLKKIVEYRFEGVGAYDGPTAPTDSYNVKANPNLPDGYDIKGMYGAMCVVIKNGEIAGLFLRSSTLPNKYILSSSSSYRSGCIKSGIYNIQRHNHKSSFAALTLTNLSGSVRIPSIIDGNGTRTYSTAINLHHNYGKESNRSSLGCQVMPKYGEWENYIKIYDYYGDIDKTWSHNESKYNKGITLRDTIVGKYVVHRCINISVKANGKTWKENCKCHHVLTD